MRRLAVGLGLGVLFALACRSDFQKECPVGELTCACNGSDECIGSLSCVSGVCVDDAGETGDSSAAESGAEAESTSSGEGESDTTTGDGDGDTTSTGDGDGDGDTTTTGDGDGDGDSTTTGDGDGDGDSTTTGDGDGDGDTTTTGDGDGDGDGDACTTGRACIPDAPFGWEGPVALNLEDDLGSAQTACPGDLPVKVEDLLYGYAQGGASCACSCAAPNDVSCPQTGELAYLQSCGGVPADHETLGSSCESLSIPGGTDVEYVPPEPTIGGGGCAPVDEGQIVDAGFDQVALACEGSGPQCGSGPTSGSCLVDDVSGFERFCIYSESASSCPSGPYDTEYIVHTGMQGQWSCPDCTCGGVEASCGGTLSAHNTDTGCSAANQIAFVDAAGCLSDGDFDDADGWRVTGITVDNASCPPDDPTPAPDDSPTAVGQRLYCCIG